MAKDVAELKQQYIDGLLEERAKIDAELQALGANRQRASRPQQAPQRATRRARGGKTLKHFITQVLTETGKAMSISEIEAAVKDAGFKSKAQKLYGAVSTSLRSLSEEVDKVSRGLYQISTRAPAAEPEKPADKPKRKAAKKKTAKKATKKRAKKKTAKRKKATKK